MSANNQPPETVTRYAVILRNCNGVGELLGQLHQSADVAGLQAVSWLAHYNGAFSAEVVTIQVPTSGQVVPDPRDILKMGTTNEQAH